MPFSCEYNSAITQLEVKPISAITSLCSGYTFEFSNYLNHDYTEDETITVSLNNNTAGRQSSVISYTAASVGTVTFEPTSDIVGDSTPLLVNFTTNSVDLSSSFNIAIEFPARYNDVVTPSESTSFFTGTIS